MNDGDVAPVQPVDNTARALIDTVLVGEALEHGPVAVFVFDDSFRYVAVNDYACRLLGYTREELLELRMTDVARYDGARRDYAEMVTAGSQTGTVVLSRKDGDEVPVTYYTQQTTVAGLTFYVSVVVLNGHAGPR